MSVSSDLQFIDVGAGDSLRRIAVRGRRTERPAIVWLSGYKSSMDSFKATAVSRWATDRGYPLIRFDYSGTGLSSGRFEDSTISDWHEETRKVITEFAPKGAVVVGSSLGAWIALLAMRNFTAHGMKSLLKEIILVAPAVDFTERLLWNAFDDEIKRNIKEQGVWYRPTRLGDTQLFTLKLIEDGRQNLLLDDPLSAPVPVHILHGMADQEISWRYTLDLVSHLNGPSVFLTLIKGADHVLHRQEDMSILLDVIDKAMQS
jgi:pimeloyl-ACP methyl ester carboxylesterase